MKAAISVFLCTLASGNPKAEASISVSDAPPGVSPTQLVLQGPHPLRVGLLQRIDEHLVFASAFPDVGRRCRNALTVQSSPESAPPEGSRRRKNRRSQACAALLSEPLSAPLEQVAPAILSGIAFHPAATPDLKLRVEAWRLAWEQGDFTSYRDFYTDKARQFPPQRNWLANKRTLMAKRGHDVRIRISDPIALADDKVTHAIFVQNYETPDHHDLGIKILTFENASGRIILERWARLPEDSPWATAAARPVAMVDLPRAEIAKGPTAPPPLENKNVSSKEESDSESLPHDPNQIFSQEIRFLPTEILTTSFPLDE